MNKRIASTLHYVGKIKARLESLESAGKGIVRAGIPLLKHVLTSVEEAIKEQDREIRKLEIDMGQAAVAIQQLEAALTQADANTLDAADQAAIAGVPAFLASLTTPATGATASASSTAPASGSSSTTATTLPTGDTTASTATDATQSPAPATTSGT